MLKWLTRKDGNRAAKAARRLSSPRASVFSEFALVMPIVLLCCSALLETTGYWDAQVMANHAAWTVGRIAMVRGSDGLAFSKDLAKKSKTGISGSSLPDELKEALSPFDDCIKDVNKLVNNRGNVATMFLMSTCGIGYYGDPPGKELSIKFTELCESATSTITNALPTYLKESFSKEVGKVVEGKLSFAGGAAESIAAFVNKLVGGFVDLLVKWAVSPIIDALSNILKNGFEQIFGTEGSKVDELFNGNGAAARRARQLYGAASRIVRAKETIGKEVVTVEDKDGLSGGYLFAKKSTLGRLAYPQVADKESTSDGYFVTGVHGWPANDGGLAMVHVEIDWPYEAGWLFPIVSGRGSAADAAPVVAKGHSMVFPQPDIRNDQLYSEGAKAFDPGSYTNISTDIGDLAKEMTNYLKRARFCMKFRICDETLTHEDDGVYWFKNWKYVPQLRELWEDEWATNSYPHKEGDYGQCWKAFTDDSSQRTLWDTLKKYFEPTNYHNCDYFYWNDENPGHGLPHKSYHEGICNSPDAGLVAWYDDPVTPPQNFRGGTSSEAYAIGRLKKDREKQFKNFYNQMDNKTDFLKKKVKCGKAFELAWEFAERNHMNVRNLQAWQHPNDSSAVERWVELDQEVRTRAWTAKQSFQKLRNFVRSEIRELDEMAEGKGQWTGDEDDPVFDPDDEEIVKDPAAAAQKAKDKWKALQEKLKVKLAEVDAAAEALRKQWDAYNGDVYNFTSNGRTKCIDEGFPKAFLQILNSQTKMEDLTETKIDDWKASIAQKVGNDMGHDIEGGTRIMIGSLKSYQAKLQAMYDKEVEYGALMGLKTAGQAKREGKSLEEVIDSAGGVAEDTPGTLTDGSDGGAIIEKDRQKFSGGQWQWY